MKFDFCYRTITLILIELNYKTKIILEQFEREIIEEMEEIYGFEQL